MSVPDHLDVNADVGEGFPFDRQLLDVISSANVACGFHAGDEESMRRLCRWCREKGVAIGAQVSYRDREGFGRRRVDIGYDQLRADIVQQMHALARAARSESAAIAYVKPHGALYNRVVSGEEQAAAVIDAVSTLDVPVLGLPGSALLRTAAEAGLGVRREFFADRGYRPDATLVPRTEPGALVTDAAEVATRVTRLVEHGTVIALDGTQTQVRADSICIHGDSPDAVGLARAVVSALEACGVAVRAVW